MCTCFVEICLCNTKIKECTLEAVNGLEYLQYIQPCQCVRKVSYAVVWVSFLTKFESLAFRHLKRAQLILQCNACVLWGLVWLGFKRQWLGSRELLVYHGRSQSHVLRAVLIGCWGEITLLRGATIGSLQEEWETVVPVPGQNHTHSHSSLTGYCPKVPPKEINHSWALTPSTLFRYLSPADPFSTLSWRLILLPSVYCLCSNWKVPPWPICDRTIQYFTAFLSKPLWILTIGIYQWLWIVFSDWLFRGREEVRRQSIKSVHVSLERTIGRMET